MLFSERKGLKYVNKVIQIDSMNDELRIGLWNIVTSFWPELNIHYFREIKEYINMHFFCKLLWGNYFNKPIDELKLFWEEIYKEIKTYYFECKWYEVYDFIEFAGNNCFSKKDKDKFYDRCNSIMKRKSSGYRFIDNKIVQISDEEELLEIEEAIGFSDKLKPVSEHLKNALQKLSDRNNPD